MWHIRIRRASRTVDRLRVMGVRAHVNTIARILNHYSKIVES